MPASKSILKQVLLHHLFFSHTGSPLMTLDLYSHTCFLLSANLKICFLIVFMLIPKLLANKLFVYMILSINHFLSFFRLNTKLLDFLTSLSF